MSDEGETMGIDGKLADWANALSQDSLDCRAGLTL